MNTVDKLNETKNLTAAELQALQAQVVGWASQGITRVLRGAQYQGARNLYQALGYEAEPTFQTYYDQYKRQDMARAVIDRPVSATWRGPIDILESHDDEVTPLERAWRQLDNDLQLKRNLIRLDTLAGLGRYAVLFMGFSDVTDRARLTEPVTAPVQLLYVRPLSEANAEIASYEANPANPRYGAPLTYKLTIAAPGGDKTETLTVHHTRVLHVTEGLLESDHLGDSRLTPVYHRLKDLEKLVGGSAEMFWRGARPGYYGNVSPDTILDEATKKALREQLDEYEHNLRRFLISSGIDIQELASQVADPSNHVDVQIQMISAATGIPKRILTGSERGELASTEDRDNWLEVIQSRREEFAEPVILYPFIEHLITCGALPAPSTAAEATDTVRLYQIKWQDLWSISQKDKAELGQLRAQSLNAYLNTPMAFEILPPEMFFKLILGLDDSDVELIERFIEAQIAGDSPFNEDPAEVEP